MSSDVMTGLLLIVDVVTHIAAKCVCSNGIQSQNEARADIESSASSPLPSSSGSRVGSSRQKWVDPGGYPLTAVLETARRLSRCTKLRDYGKKASFAALNWETQPADLHLNRF
jgi:hypothetical protein